VPDGRDENDDGSTAVRRFAESLGYPPGEIGRLSVALTHTSFANEAGGDMADNERLEFLGDAVLGLLVGHGLFRAHPAAQEGTLSRLRAGLVNARNLAELAAGLGLGSMLRLGHGEELTGGRGKASILANAYEAVIGAVYLDLGLRATWRVVGAHFAGRLSSPRVGAADQDFKTRLQELVQSRFRSTPLYRVVAERGPDHEKEFEVVLLVAEQPIARGVGRSKKEAERAAAGKALGALLAQDEASDSV